MASGLVAELYAKHQNSPQPSSQAVCAVLGASLEVLQAEGLEASPASLFAAVMSSLEKPDGKGPPEICTALCTILNACCTRLPDSLVRSKFVNCSKIILEIMRMHEQQASLMRQAVEALGLVTSAMDPNSWVHATEPFNRLLGLSFDSRPKVRRAAQQALANVFAAIQGQPVLSNASDTLVQVSQQILPGPEAALTKSRGKKNVQQHNNVIVQKALTDALHALNLLKLVLPLATEKVVTQIASMLPKLFAVGHTVLSCQAGETLSALCNSSTSKIRADHLGPLLSKFCSMDQMWQTRDTDVQLTLLKLVESGYTRLYALDTKIALSELEEGFSRVFTALSLPHDGTRRAAQLVLKNLIHSYIEGSTVEEAKQLRQIFRIVEQGLDVAHQDTLISVLPVVEELFENVNASHATVVIEIIEGTGSICSLAQQNNEEEEGEEDELRGIIKAANSAMGAAIRKLGPEVILTVLPLRLQVPLQAKEGQGNNLWLLPLLRQYVGNTSLGFWGKAMLPLARSLVESASNLTAGSEQQIQAVQLKVLEQQIWNLLPSFCIWPTDLASAFSEHAQTLGKAFQNRPDLQPTICLALRRLCTQAKVASQEQGSVEGSRSAFIPQDLDDEEEDEMLANDFSDIPSHYSELVAERDLQALRGFAKNWMPLLFNAFVEAKPGYRSHLAGAISAYASVSDPSVLESFFKTIVKKLIKTLGGKSKTSESIEEGEGTEKRCTFMELALCLASGLPRSAIQVLQKIASPASQEKDQAIQKRAYRLLAYILEERKDYTHEHFQEVLDNLLLGVASSMSAAKRYRLRCLKAAVLMMQGPNPPSLVLNEEEMGLTIEAEKKQQVTSLLVGEIILCIKEVNKKTRIAAYELLVSLAHTMHETNPPPFQGISDAAMGENEGQSRGGLNDLFNMVLAGLIGATPHMISASIMALARLLYEFSSHLQVAAPELLPVVLSLFRSKAREIIKSVLGFVKVCVMKLPVEVLQQNLEAILEGILIWSEDSKNKFRLKVRVIVERLVRRLDYETVAEHLPEGDRKLLTHIRKEQQRKAKKGQSEAGSEADIEDEVTVVRSRNGKQIANRSEWGHSRVFSSDEDELETKSKKTARSSKRPVANGKANLNKAKGKLAGLRLSNQEDDEPMDLLESANFRSMERQAAGQGRPSTEPDFPMDGARMVINEEAPTKKSKRKRGGGIDTAASDDSDFDDLHHIRGATAALRLDGQSGAASLAGKSGFKSDAKTQGAKTMSGKTFAGRSAGGKSKQSERQGKEHSGKRYAASKQGAGGDVKGKSKHSPYAYWPLDRKMINRRTGKKVEAAKGLASVLQTSQGSLKGSKAKRQKR